MGALNPRTASGGTSDGAINVVLRYLRAIERKVDRLIDNNEDVLARVPALEASLALILDRIGRVSIVLTGGLS